MQTLSIVIPVFNEKNTILKVLDAVLASDTKGLKKEIIIVDDFSTDGTREILQSLESNKSYKIFYRESNQGKGAAIRFGFSRISGDFAIIQDADLEYNPSDYSLLLAPLIDSRAEVVFGSRFTGSFPHRVLFFWHYVGNKFLTLFSNLLTNLNLSDMETGYKAFTKDAILKILPYLKSNRFGIEPELTAQVAKHNLRIYEVGISYSGRTYSEGKKINWKDGLAAIWFIVRYNLFN